MNFTALPINSILIAPDAMHPQIRQSIMQQKDGVLGLHIQSASQFLATWMPDDLPSNPIILFQMYNLVKESSLPLQTYQKIVESAGFLKECLQFINDICFYGIPLSAVPQNTQAQKELFSLLSLFSDIPTINKAKHIALEQIKEESFEHVYIVDCLTPMQDNTILTQLLHQGAHLLSDEPHEVNKQFFHAVNKRQEIEACAQSIISHKQQAEDVQITMCDASYAPLLQQIFSRYKIPCTIMGTKQTSLLAKQFIALFNFALNPVSESLMKCIDTGIFAGLQLRSLREYVQTFEQDIFQPFTHVRTLSSHDTLVNERDFEKLKKLEEEASLEQAALLPILQPLLKEQNPAAILEHIIAIIQEHIPISKNELSIYHRIHSLLQDVYPYIRNKEDIAFLIALLEDVQMNMHTSIFQGALIHGLTQASLPRKYHYLLGTTQTNYPAFQTKKGIFDEAYYAQIPAYPTMEERYAYHQQCLSNLLIASDNLCISYPLGTYEGKGLECALEIEQFMKTPSKSYPLRVNYTEIPPQQTIAADTAKKLFLQDGKLNGSISSLERYVECPYSYFLRYGLFLQEPMKVGFPNSYAGTLSHFILETLTTTYGKAYANATQDKISAILDKELNNLQQLFPAMQEALFNVKQRLLTSMIQTLETLKEFEEHSSLSPARSEYPFTFEIPLEDELILSLHGYIDRVDESSELACILDYKSSAKILSETNVFAALQLQLLTYAMVIAKESGKAIAGAYYVSLKNENITCSAGKMSRRKPVTHHVNDKTDFEIERRKAQRFNGWTMDEDASAIDDDGSHISGLRMNKDGIVKSSKLYDLNVLTTYMEKLYNIIAKRILQGDIACKPQVDACTYCVYHEICRFKGFYEEKAQLVEAGNDIYQKGEKEDA